MCLQQRSNKDQHVSAGLPKIAMIADVKYYMASPGLSTVYYKSVLTTYEVGPMLIPIS